MHHFHFIFAFIYVFYIKTLQIQEIEVGGVWVDLKSRIVKHDCKKHWHINCGRHSEKSLFKIITKVAYHKNAHYCCEDGSWGGTTHQIQFLRSLRDNLVIIMIHFQHLWFLISAPIASWGTFYLVTIAALRNQHLCFAYFFVSYCAVINWLWVLFRRSLPATDSWHWFL